MLLAEDSEEDSEVIFSRSSSLIVSVSSLSSYLPDYFKVISAENIPNDLIYTYGYLKASMSFSMSVS